MQPALIPCPVSSREKTSRRWILGGSLLTTVGCAVVLIATSRPLPMAWDEGNAIVRAEGITRWAGRWFSDPAGNDPSAPSPMSEAAIAKDWQYTTRIEGHPAFYGIVIAAGQALSPSWLDPLTRARWGPMLLAALAGGAMFYRTARQWSTVAATGAVVAWLLLPRMFAHLHFASFDGPLTSCWILAWATFAPARRSRGWAVVWGLALGTTLACKATGWLAPVPFVIWALAYRDRPAVRAILIGLPVAAATFYLLNPPLWHHPIDGFRAFLDLNLHRADRPWHNVATQFFGRMCDLDHPLPWYNTIVWTAITVPLGILALTLAGVISTTRCLRSEPAGSLVLGHWLVLLVVRALPMAPPHDGVRLLLPGFAFLAVLAGIGCGSLWRWTSRQRSAGRIAPRWLAATGIGLLYLTSAGSLFWYAPQWLSYYNLLIGGLPGATARGMEPTYYWDALDRPTLDWLNENTAEGEKISFAAAPPENLMLMQRWGWLEHPWQEEAPGRWAWRVVQHRPSSCQPADRRLIEREPAAYEKTIRQGGWGPWRLDVRLVGVFPYPQYVEARRADSAP